MAPGDCKRKRGTCQEIYQTEWKSGIWGQADVKCGFTGGVGSSQIYTSDPSFPDLVAMSHPASTSC